MIPEVLYFIATNAGQSIQQSVSKELLDTLYIRLLQVIRIDFEVRKTVEELKLLSVVFTSQKL